MTRLKPLGTRLVLRREPAPESIGKIILPDKSKERPTRGEVLAVGPGKRKPDGTWEPLQVRVGDVVLYGSYAGVVVPGEKDLIIVGEDAVMAVVEPVA